MNPQSTDGFRQEIEIGSDLLETIGTDALTALIGLGADIVFLVDKSGTVRESYHRNPELDAYGLSANLGKKLRDCVTVESIPKIDALLAPSDKPRPKRGYQVNHSAAGLPDLPVAYSAGVADGFPFTILVGREMRQQMQDQQRLVEAQIAMEADYRELRQAEARYRTLFKMSERAYLIVDGEKKTVLEANPAAMSLVAANRSSLSGKLVRDLLKKQDRDRFGDAMGEARHSGEPVEVTGLHSASGTYIDASLRAYRENGSTNLVITLNERQDDETSTLRAGGLPDGAEMEIEGLPEAALVTDASGIIRSANTLFLDQVHAPTQHQVLGRNAANWLGKSAVEFNVLLARIVNEKMISGFASAVTDWLGETRNVSLSGRYNEKAQTVQLLLIPLSAAPEKLALQPPSTPEQAEGFASLVGKVPLKQLIRESLDVVEKICIEAALDQTNNNRASAAEMLGLSRQSLYIKLRRHGLENYSPESSN
jgi:transcriptional regulator PpsR